MGLRLRTWSGVDTLSRTTSSRTWASRILSWGQAGLRGQPTIPPGRRRRGAQRRCAGSRCLHPLRLSRSQRLGPIFLGCCRCQATRHHTQGRLGFFVWSPATSSLRPSQAPVTDLRTGRRRSTGLGCHLHCHLRGCRVQTIRLHQLAGKFLEFKSCQSRSPSFCSSTRLSRRPTGPNQHRRGC